MSKRKGPCTEAAYRRCATHYLFRSLYPMSSWSLLHGEPRDIPSAASHRPALLIDNSSFDRYIVFGKLQFDVTLIPGTFYAAPCWAVTFRRRHDLNPRFLPQVHRVVVDFRFGQREMETTVRTARG